jgi:uncharacterized protein YecE (DUF72 family)
MKKLFVGTSGFSYPQWRGHFYPEDFPASQQLEFYAEHFNSVEINNSFYHLPKRATYEGWARRTPAEFRFVIKGSRYITQFLQLKNTTEAVQKFFEPASALEKKLAVVLWQLPPSLKGDPLRLKAFIEELQKSKTGKSIRHAFEFRHATWFDEEVYRLMRDYNCGFVIAHSNRWASAEAVTADFVYLRFHGAPDLFASNYSDKSLKEWAAKAKKWARGRDLFAYFNNDALSFAVPNAQRLREFLAAKSK